MIQVDFEHFKRAVGPHFSEELIKAKLANLKRDGDTITATIGEPRFLTAPAPCCTRVLVQLHGMPRVCLMELLYRAPRGGHTRTQVGTPSWPISTPRKRKATEGAQAAAIKT